MEARIALKYSGPAVESGLMDVYEASANMIALSEFIVAAAKTVYGDSAEARAEVAGFARGSFLTDLVFNVAHSSATIFSSFSIDQLWKVVGGAIDLWKHLKGSPPSNIVNNNQTQTVEVSNNSGQIIQVHADSLLLVMNDKASESVEKFVKHALEKAGMDSVSLTSDKAQIAHITQSEAHSFTNVTPSQNITDVIIKMGLIIESPVFKEENKWRFSDGQNSFYADIEDPEFLAKVNTGERFGKGDILLADVRISQEQSGLRITATRSIVKVHEHKVAATQMILHQ
jgi:hypothetical protein